MTTVRQLSRVGVSGWLAALVLFASAPAAADMTGYAGVVTMKAEDAGLAVTHHHDWSDRTRARRFRTTDHFAADQNDFAWIEVKDAATGVLLFRRSTPALARLWIAPGGDFIVGLSDIMLWNPYQIVVFDRSGALVLKQHITPEEACFRADEIEAWLAKRPKLRPILEQRIATIGDRVYVDFDFDDSPRLLGNRAWNELYRRHCPSHFSPSFTESETNNVYWFRKADPDLRIEKDGERAVGVSLLDPKGKRFTVPFAPLRK
jgi:hypothetical protein